MFKFLFIDPQPDLEKVQQTVFVCTEFVSGFFVVDTNVFFCCLQASLINGELFSLWFLVFLHKQKTDVCLSPSGRPFFS